MFKWSDHKVRGLCDENIRSINDRLFRRLATLSERCKAGEVEHWGGASSGMISVMLCAYLAMIDGLVARIEDLEKRLAADD